ncbi:MAG: hypothetical protein IT375_20700 [Polyangiaceae bacterium]|nr:hypothetical protein [Polyangiaceae bacterium]
MRAAAFIVCYSLFGLSSGCSEGSSSGGVGGTSGASGEAGAGGVYSGGGTGGGSEVPVEVLTGPLPGVASPRLLDDGYIYYRAKEPKGGYNSGTEWLLKRVPKAGGPIELILKADTALYIMTTDASAYYVQIPQTSDDNGVAWTEDIKRLPFGTSAPEPFIDAVNSNDDFFYLAQGPAGLFFAVGHEYYKTTLAGYAKPGPNSLFWSAKLDGFLEQSWVQDDHLYFAGKDATQKYSIGRVPLAGGIHETVVDYPDLCRPLGPTDGSQGFVAVCTGTAGQDVAVIDLSGAVTTLAANVIPQDAYKLTGPRAGILYWQGDDALYAFNLSTKGLSALTLKSGYSMFAIDEAHVYAFAANSAVVRSPLSALQPVSP